ncbi:MAG: hypothetical protein H6671_16975 [Anaerolineaceae bacterium]|nr:hypothetical protein [Anaerolineaceae bacterium]
MPIQIPYRLLTIFLISLCPLLMSRPAYTQDEAPAPQFLFRDGNHLVLVNGYTGETSQLPFAVSDNDYFSWSLDGRYLLARFHEVDGPAYQTYCLNLYDVDALAWLYDEPLACAVEGVALSPNNTRLVYATTDGLNGTLWLYNLADEMTQELYRTTDGVEPLYPSGVSNMQWSPAETYLTFVDYDQILGGSINTFVVMNVQDRAYITLNALDSYYADYDPIWSADENWFLIRLQDRYVTSSTLPISNDEGDIYLVNAATGDKVRVTYTPTVYENGVGWTEDGQIIFKEWLLQETILTLEQALNIPEVPPEDIITPEPVPLGYGSPRNIRLSPDAMIGSWVTHQGAGADTYMLYIGFVADFDPVFNWKLPEYYEYGSVLIGWRPSNYPYPPG